MLRLLLAVVVVLSFHSAVLAAGALVLDVAPDDWVNRAAAKVVYPDEPLKKEFDRIEERIRKLLQAKALKLPKVVRKAGEQVIRPSVMDASISVVTEGRKPGDDHEVALADLAIVQVLPAARDNVILFLRPTAGFVPIKKLDEGAIAPRREWERERAKKLTEWLDQFEKNLAQ